MFEAENSGATAGKSEIKYNFENQPDGYEYVPVLVEKSPECELNNLEKEKFLLSSKLTIIQLQFKIRTLLKLPVEKCLFLYTDNYRVWKSSTTFEELYEHFNKKVIHMKYTDENLYVTDICDKLRENVGAAEPKVQLV